MTERRVAWKDELFDYQIEAVQFLLETPRAILRLDTGLGKTLTCIAYAEAWQKVVGRPVDVLVIAPAFLVLNWKREISKWCSHKIDCSFEVISYSRFSKGSSLQGKYDICVCDEAHYLKSWSAKRTKVLCKEVLPKISRVVLSTATPYVRSAEDLHSLYSVCEPGRWGTLSKFRERYCKSKPNPFSSWKGAKIYYGVRSEKASELKKKGDVFTFFRRKSDVLESLPEKIETDLLFETPRDLLKENIEIDESFDINTGRITGGLSSVLSTELKKLEMWKVEKAFEWVEEFDSKRPLVVFCKHREPAISLADKLDCNCITGESLMMVRHEIVEQFQAGEFNRLVCTIGSCGVGINLFRADTALFVGLPWSYTELKQCEDRLHRIGQKNTVNIYRMYAEGSLDDLVVSQISQKFSGEEVTIGGWE